MNMTPSRTIGIAFVAMLSMAVGCMGPTKMGIEARENAARHFNQVRSKIDYDQSMQAFNRGQMLEARRLLDTAIAKLPDDATYYVLLGRICLETSQMENAIKALEEAVRLDAELPDPRYYLGIAAERMKESDQAAARFLEAYELDGETPQYLTAAAEVLISEGRLAEAETLLSRDAARFRNNSVIHHLRGKISMMNGRWTDAVDSLRRATLIDENDVWLLTEYARAQFAAGHHASCLNTLLQIEQHPDPSLSKSDLMRMRTRCFVDSRRYRDAHRALCDYTSKFPNDIDGWIDLGLVCREIGDIRRLRQAGNRLTLLDRNRFEGYFMLGCSFLEEGNHSKAIAFFEQSARIAPDRNETWLALGMSYEQSGNLVKAFRAYAKADSEHAHELMTQVVEVMD